MRGSSTLSTIPAISNPSTTALIAASGKARIISLNPLATEPIAPKFTPGTDSPSTVDTPVTLEGASSTVPVIGC